MQLCNNCLNEDKAARKQKVVDAEEVHKAANPYARPTPGKCFKYNQTGH